MLKIRKLKSNLYYSRPNFGFTILEIMVSIALFTIVIILVSSMYTLAQRSYNKGSSRGELAQNARVSLDRISREIRQSVDIITILPEVNDDPENPPAEEIFFQDGHDINDITYLHYYLDNTNLMRSHVVYYFEEDPSTYVLWDSSDAIEDIIENRVVGEYFNSMEFWGEDGLVNIDLVLTKNQNEFNISTSVFSRN